MYIRMQICLFHVYLLKILVSTTKENSNVIAGFLSGRIQRVVVDGVGSEDVMVVSGVP